MLDRGKFEEPPGTIDERNLPKPIHHRFLIRQQKIDLVQNLNPYAPNADTVLAQYNLTREKFNDITRNLRVGGEPETVARCNKYRKRTISPEVNLEPKSAIPVQVIAEESPSDSAPTAEAPFANKISLIDTQDYTKYSDEDLITPLKEGNMDTWNELIRRYELKVKKLISKYISDFQIVEDLSQDTLFRVYNNIEKFDTTCPFGPWINRIAKNIVLDYLRKIKRKGKWIKESDGPEGYTTDEEVPVVEYDSDLRAEIELVLNSMPPEYANIMRWRDLEQQSTEEVASRINRAIATVRWRLTEARRMFREKWEARLSGH